MLLRSITIAVSIAVMGPLSPASPILSLEAPIAYTPGTPFHVYAVLTGADNLASFSADVVLSSSLGVAGTDYFFSAAARPSAQYVFSGNSTIGFSHSSVGPGPLTVGDALADLLKEVSTVHGVNDRLADITVNTLASFNGQLTLSFDKDFLLVDNKSGASVTGYDSMIAGLLPVTVVVPEPTSLVFLAGGLAAVGLTRQRAAKTRR